MARLKNDPTNRCHDAGRKRQQRMSFAQTCRNPAVQADQPRLSEVAQ